MQKCKKIISLALVFMLAIGGFVIPLQANSSDVSGYLGGPYWNENGWRLNPEEPLFDHSPTAAMPAFGSCHHLVSNPARGHNELISIFANTDTAGINVMLDWCDRFVTPNPTPANWHRRALNPTHTTGEVHYRQAGGTWSYGFPLVVYDNRHMATSLFNLMPAADYEVRVVIRHEGVVTDVQYATFTTQPVWERPAGTNIVNVYSQAEFIVAVAAAVPGDEIRLCPLYVSQEHLGALNCDGVCPACRFQDEEFICPNVNREMSYRGFEIIGLNGTEDAPIIISSQDPDMRPIIRGQFTVRDSSFVVFCTLQMTNCGMENLLAQPNLHLFQWLGANYRLTLYNSHLHDARTTSVGGAGQTNAMHIIGSPLVPYTHHFIYNNRFEDKTLYYGRRHTEPPSGGLATHLNNQTYFGINIRQHSAVGPVGRQLGMITIRSNTFAYVDDAVHTGGWEKNPPMVLCYENLVYDTDDFLAIWGIEEIGVYDNIMFGQDDAIESDGHAVNARFLRNNIGQSNIALSIAATYPGPVFFIENVVHSIETAGIKMNTNSVGGVHEMTFNAFFFHNTILQYDSGQLEGPGQRRSALYWLSGRVRHVHKINNIFVSRERALNADFPDAWAFYMELNQDFNLYHVWNLHPTNPVVARVMQTVYGPGTDARIRNFACWYEYQALNNRRNDINSIFADPLICTEYLTSPAPGYETSGLRYLTLDPSSPAINAGTFIPGVSRSFEPNIGADQSYNNFVALPVPQAPVVAPCDCDPALVYMLDWLSVNGEYAANEIGLSNRADEVDQEIYMGSITLTTVQATDVTLADIAYATLPAGGEIDLVAILPEGTAVTPAMVDVATSVLDTERTLECGEILAIRLVPYTNGGIYNAFYAFEISIDDTAPPMVISPIRFFGGATGDGAIYADMTGATEGRGLPENVAGNPEWNVPLVPGRITLPSDRTVLTAYDINLFMSATGARVHYNLRRTVFAPGSENITPQHISWGGNGGVVWGTGGSGSTPPRTINHGELIGVHVRDTYRTGVVIKVYVVCIDCDNYMDACSCGNLCPDCEEDPCECPPPRAINDIRFFDNTDAHATVYVDLTYATEGCMVESPTTPMVPGRIYLTEAQATDITAYNIRVLLANETQTNWNLRRMVFAPGFEVTPTNLQNITGGANWGTGGAGSTPPRTINHGEIIGLRVQNVSPAVFVAVEVIIVCDECELYPCECEDDLPVFGWNIFNNGPGGAPSRPNASLAASGIIRMWAQLDGTNTPVYFDSADTVVALDQDGDCAMEFIRVNRMWVAGSGWANYFNLVDVNKNNGCWQYINLYITVYGQTVHALLVNALFIPPAGDVTVTFVVEAGALGVYAATTTTVVVPAGEEISVEAIPSTVARTGFYFAGWYPSDPAEFGVVTEDITFTARFSPLFHYVTFEAGNGGQLVPTSFGLVVSIRDGFSFWPDRVPMPVANDGYEFVGWTPYNPAGFVVREAITFTAVFAPATPVEPRIVSVTPVPVVVEQGGTVELIVTTQGMPDGAWVDLNVAWRPGLSIVGGPRFTIVDNQAIITVAATENTLLGRDGFSVAARTAGDWGSVILISSYAFVIEVI